MAGFINPNAGYPEMPPTWPPMATAQTSQGYPMGQGPYSMISSGPCSPCGSGTDPLRSSGSFCNKNPCNYYYEFIPGQMMTPGQGVQPARRMSPPAAYMPSQYLSPPPMGYGQQSQVSTPQVGMPYGGNFQPGQSQYIPHNDSINSYLQTIYGGTCQPTNIGGSVWKGCSNSPYQNMGYFTSGSVNAWY